MPAPSTNWASSTTFKTTSSEYQGIQKEIKYSLWLFGAKLFYMSIKSTVRGNKDLEKNSASFLSEGFSFLSVVLQLP